ncbi:MAG TPA: hypothetical protein PKD55_04325 [Bellilinea sp.]|nr:hypothetical protein [Bellilinea sp.]
MSKEGPPLQFDMFTGEAVDNRTRQQRKQDKERQQPKQIEMFSSREVAQFGVNPRPLLPLSPNTKLLLIPEDPRTDEEIEQDRQRAALEQTYKMFPEPAATDEADQPKNLDSEIVPDTTTLALVPRGVVALVVLGHFAHFDPR